MSRLSLWLGERRKIRRGIVRRLWVSGLILLRIPNRAELVFPPNLTAHSQLHIQRQLRLEHQEIVEALVLPDRVDHVVAT